MVGMQLSMRTTAQKTKQEFKAGVSKNAIIQSTTICSVYAFLL